VKRRRINRISRMDRMKITGMQRRRIDSVGKDRRFTGCAGQKLAGDRLPPVAKLAIMRSIGLCPSFR